MTFWGYHLMLDCSKCAHRQIRTKYTIQSFAKALVNEIKMVPYGEPQVVMFGTGNKKGYTLVQLIETSNICGHFVEETNDMYLDVFSCKPFEQDDVIKTVDKFFKPKLIRPTFVIRDARNHFNAPVEPQMQ